MEGRERDEESEANTSVTDFSDSVTPEPRQNDELGREAAPGGAGRVSDSTQRTPNVGRQTSSAGQQTPNARQQTAGVSGGFRASNVSETARRGYVDYDAGPDHGALSGRYGLSFVRDGQAAKVQRLEDEFGSDRVSRWVEEGMTVETMGKPRDMRAFRERQEGRSAAVPTDIERQNQASVQRSEEAARDDGPAGDAGVPDVVREVVSSPGTSMDESVQREMESKMGGDFGDVRVHTGPQAAAAADAINARAFTVGNHVAFNEGEYDPSSTEGKEVLAHELTHVRQQTDGALSLLPKAETAQQDGHVPVPTGFDVQPKLEVSSPDDPAEKEAERVAERVVEMDAASDADGETAVHAQSTSQDTHAQTHASGTRTTDGEQVHRIIGGIKNAAESVVEGVKNVGKSVVDSAKNAFNAVAEGAKNLGSEAWDVIESSGAEAWEALQECTSAVWETLKDSGQRLWDALETNTELLVNMVKEGGRQAWELLEEGGQAVWEVIESGGRAVWSAITESGRRVWTLLEENTELVLTMLQDGSYRIWEVLKEGGSRAWTVLKECGTSVWKELTSRSRWFWNLLRENAVLLADVLKEGGRQVWDTLKAGGRWVWNAIENGGRVVWEALSNCGRRLWNLLRENTALLASMVADGGKRAWNLLKDAGQRLWSIVEDAGQQVWSALVAVAEGFWEFLERNGKLLWSFFETAGEWAWDVLKRAGQLFWHWLKDLPERAVRILGHLARGVAEIAEWFWNGLKLLFTDPSELGEWFVDGILRGLTWVGSLFLLVRDLKGKNHLFTLMKETIKPNTRELTDKEVTEASRVLGDTLDYSAVRVDEDSLISHIGKWLNNSEKNAKMGVVTFHTVNVDQEVDTAKNTSDMAFMIHELTHVAQYEGIGGRYMAEAIHAQEAGAGYEYSYEELENESFSYFNREQQGSIMQDYYGGLLEDAFADEDDADLEDVPDDAPDNIFENWEDSEDYDNFWALYRRHVGALRHGNW